MSHRSSARTPLPPPARIGAILWTAASLAAGAAAGVVLFFAALDCSRGVPNGVWWTYLEGQSPRMALRARARHAIYETGRGRALYWTAFTDSGGEPLDRRRHYKIVSEALPARFWSITLYDTEDRLLPNDWERYSVTSLDVSTETDGSFAINVSPNPIPGAMNWIPSGRSPRDDRRFLAYLRMYGLAPPAGSGPSTLALPAIVRVPD
jgi:hypothetical protein